VVFLKVRIIVLPIHVQDGVLVHYLGQILVFRINTNNLLMSRRFIVLLTFVLALYVSVEAQEKWNFKVNSGTTYAIPSGIFGGDDYAGYRKNKTWYPGYILGMSLSYNVLPCLAVESGLNFERIRTGYYAYYSDANNPGTGYGTGYGNSETYIPGTSYMVKEHYSKNYLNVPLHIALKTSSNFGFFGGIGYRLSLNKELGMDRFEEWNEWTYTGGLFVNFGKVSSRFSYTEGGNNKDRGEFSKSRTISLTVGYTLWKKQ
jgi:hypothetical protein